ncbi:hypothetical protein C0991_004395 [Blastosporella zonata]|nr:hypothetical protein C0991_004395 [Blastosporella zonata]
MREEDIARERTANHPPDSQVPTFKPPPKNPKKNTLQPNDSSRDLQDTGGQNEDSEEQDLDIRSSPEPTPKRVLRPHANTETRYTSPMRLDDDNEYRPPAPMDKNNKEDLDDQENDITDQPQDVNLSVSSRRKPRRNDITALRITDVASGKRAASVVPEPPSIKKPKLTKKKTNTFNDGWDLKRRTAVVIPAPEFMVNDDSMAQYGGFVGDNEDDTAERISVRVAGPVVRGQEPLPSLIKIKNQTTFTPRTQKELRGVTPLARRKAGTIAPWANLLSSQVQELVDAVFGQGTYTVGSGDVWTGLVTYRLNDWRAGFVAAARTAVAAHFSQHAHSFPNAKAIRKAIKWYTKWHGKGPKRLAAYQWRVWEKDGKYKKGFAQSALIIETFAVGHLTNIPGEPPTATDPVDDLPTGALIIALQAVEHALNEYRVTGTRKVDKSAKGYFSSDNYGDNEVKKTDPDTGRTYYEMEVNASRYLPSVAGFVEKHWKTIFEDAHEYLLGLPSKRGKKARSSSQEQSMPDDPEEVIFVSDESGDEALAATAVDNKGLDLSSSSDSDSDSDSSENTGTCKKLFSL